jgi:hypothetical protein
MCILRHYFGLEWLERWVIKPQGQDGAFLGQDCPTAERFESHKLRVNLLAEMLVNLQDAPEFWTVVEIVARGKGAIEAGYAELEAGSLLKKRGIPFAFRKPLGVPNSRGLDYDLDIDVKGLHVCGETKCKVEATEMSVKSLLNSIGDARYKSLPADQPGAVFVKVPQIWFESEAFHGWMRVELPQYLETTGRVAIVFLSSAPEILAHGYAMSLLAWTSVVNRKSRFYDKRIEWLHEAPIVEGLWVNLNDLWAPYLSAR